MTDLASTRQADVTKSLIAEAITDYFGERCPDFDEGCVTCDVWARFDALILAALDESPIGEQGVGVRALEWFEGEPGWWGATPIYGLNYEVRVTDRGTIRIRFHGRGGWEDFKGDFAEAKAAAQADFTRRILSALSPERKEPVGWKLVPVEPTPDMLAAGDEAMVDTKDTDNWIAHCRNAWDAMLAATPGQPT